MEKLCNQDAEAIFSYLERILQEGINFKNGSYLRDYAEHAEDFFENSISAMSSIANREVPYHFTSFDIKDMLEFLGYHFTKDGGQQRRELEKASAEFKKYIDRLTELEDSPRQFYQSDEKKRDLVYICGKMKTYYQGLIDDENYKRTNDSDD